MASPSATLPISPKPVAVPAGPAAPNDLGDAVAASRMLAKQEQAIALENRANNAILQALQGR